MRKLALQLGLAACTALLAPLSHADLSDEIQVYDDAINKPGEFGLELHINTTPKGRSTPDYPGEITPHHGLRITPELSWGLTSTFEAGLYLPFVRDAKGDDYFAGPKFRLKWIPRQAPEEGGLFYGLNAELAVVQSRFAQERVALELRPILGYRTPDWLVVVNPVLGSALTEGYRGGGLDFSPGIKVGKTIGRGLQAGFEYYAEVGKLDRFNPANEQERTLYAVIDVDRKPWNFNVGIGRGLTDTTDKWTLKAIFEFPFD